MGDKPQIQLEPGRVDYANRHYMPESLVGSDVLVSDNGNDSIVYPRDLVKKEDFLLPGVKTVWYEYVPARLAEPERRTLILSCHGGLMEGWAQAVYSSWVKVAEREGYVAAFPNAANRNFWTIEYDPALEQELTAPNESGIYLNKAPADIQENVDANAILALADRLCAAYSIPRERVLIHGMSMGDMMATQMGRYYGGRFLGVAASGALSAYNVLFDPEGRPRNQGGPVQVMQTHMERDDVMAGGTGSIYEAVAYNREYWLKVNGAAAVPQITIDGENNIAYYPGKADTFFREVKNRDHGQTLDEAEIVQEAMLCPELADRWRRGDRISAAFALDRAKAFWNGSVQTLSGTVFEQSKYNMADPAHTPCASLVMAALEDLCRLFGQSLRRIKAGSAEVVLADGRRVQFSAGNSACVLENRITAMPMETVQRGEHLYVPIQWYLQKMLGLYTSRCGRVVYCTDHPAQLAKNMAYLLDQLL